MVLQRGARSVWCAAGPLSPRSYIALGRRSLRCNGTQATVSYASREWCPTHIVPTLGQRWANEPGCSDKAGCSALLVSHAGRAARYRVASDATDGLQGLRGDGFDRSGVGNERHAPAPSLQQRMRAYRGTIITCGRLLRCGKNVAGGGAGNHALALACYGERRIACAAGKCAASGCCCASLGREATQWAASV